MKKEYDPEPPVNTLRIEEISELLKSSNSSLSPEIYNLLKKHLEKELTSRVIEYKSITESHYQKLLDELEADYKQKIVFNDFTNTTQHEEVASYFTRYIQLIVLTSVAHIDAILDFYRLKERSMQSDADYHYRSNILFRNRDRILEVKNRVVKDVENLDDIKKFEDRKATVDVLEKDYGKTPPENLFSQKDGEEFERLLEKLVHTDCFLYGYNDVGTRYKKGSRGTSPEILKSSKVYCYALYTVFKTLGFTQIDSAKYTQTCLQYIYDKVVKEYEYSGASFIYKSSTILQNIKEDKKFNINFKSEPLELLIPKI